MTEENFETHLKFLEQAVEQLESGELSLEDSMQVYEEGVRRARLCREQLQRAEQRVELLQEGEDGTLVTAPFEKPGDA